MAAVFPQRKDQLIFHINNYDMVLDILMVRIQYNKRKIRKVKLITLQ
jgi:Vps52 / Sac2 family.